MKLWSVLVGIVILQGCTSVPTDDPASPWLYPPPGSIVELHRELTVPPRHTRVYLQDGEVWSYGQVDKVYPFCDFEVRQRQELETQLIQPDHFIVTRHETGEASVVALDYPQFADAEMRNRYRDWFIWKGGTGKVNRYRHLWLSSDSQDNVMRLTCYGGQARVSEARLPTLDEMRQSLGRQATLQLIP